MATNIDKALNQAPLGLGADDMAGGADVEIEIVNPEGVKIGIDGLEIDLMPDEGDEGEEFDSNLAEFMDDSELASVAGDLMSLVDADINSRKDWVEMFVRGLEVLGMKYEERTEPWNGACGVYSTVLTEAAVRFQSETIIETFPSAGPVKTEIIGAIDRLKEQAAERVREDMNYKLTEEMPEYRPEHERMLFNLGLAGAAFKKVYYDPSLGRQTSVFIPAEDIVIPYGSSGARTAERVTHTMRKTKNDVKKLQVAGFYVDIDLGEPVQVHTDVEKKKAEGQGYSLTEDDRYQIYEIQVDYDLPGYEDEKGIALPYVISIDKGTNKVLSIYRNWHEDDTLRLKRQHFVQYDYIPGFGAYGFGFVHLIGGYARAGTSLIRQLVDAGTLSNLPGGLKSRGLRLKGDDTPIAPGEFRDVDVPSGSIRDNILPLPYKEPSQVLYTLFQNIVQEGRSFASAGDMNVSDMSAQAPVGTTLAILERTLKVMGAVQARMHFSMRQEFRLLKHIIADYTPEEYSYDPEEGDRKAKKSDYDAVDVIPVSDPNAATMAQKIVQYQAALQLAQTAPQLYNLPLLHRQMIEILGIKNASKLIPLEDDQIPIDPVQENQNLLNHKPVKAFMEQNHEAHIAMHMGMMQDPKIMMLLQNNPQAPMLQAAVMAHVNEHIGFNYRREIETRIGMTLPGEETNKHVPQEMADQIAVLTAQAATAMSQQNQAMAAQQQAQQKMQDPIIQMQMQELQLKTEDLKLKQQKQIIDATAKADQIRVEESRIAAQKEIAAMQVGATAAAARDKLAKQQELEGARMGIDIAKSKAQLAHQRSTQIIQNRLPQKG
jgi:hypothetical protein